MREGHKINKLWGHNICRLTILQKLSNHLFCCVALEETNN